MEFFLDPRQTQNSNNNRYRQIGVNYVWTIFKKNYEQRPRINFQGGWRQQNKIPRCYNLKNKKKKEKKKATLTKEKNKGSKQGC